MKRTPPAYRDAVKVLKEAIEQNNTNPKAYYRLSVAQKLNGELIPAKESILLGINIAPNDLSLRNEYKSLMDLINVKHKDWFTKMNGFLHSEKT